MTAAHTTVLELLGKQVSFTTIIEVGSDVYSTNHLGVITNIVISLSSEPEISIDYGDFYALSDLLEFKII